MVADFMHQMEPGNCAIMNVLAASILLKMAIAFRVIAPIIGLFCIAFVLKNSQLHRRLHANAKLLCFLHYIWTIGLCIAYIISYGFNFIQLSLSFSNPCEYLIPTSLSFNLAAIVMVFILLQMTSMIALAIERTVATIRYKKYEKERNAALLILLIILQFVVAFLIPYVYLMPSTKWEQPAIGPSLITDDNLEKNQFFTIAFIVSELVVTIYIYALRHLNYYRRKAVRKWNSQSGLSTRYQLDENIRALNLIVPLIWLQFIFNFTTGVMVYVIVALENDLNVVTYSICDRLNGILTLYPIALLILLFFKDPLMIDHFRKNFPSKGELSKVHPSVAVTITSNPLYSNSASTPRFVIAENTNARFDQLKALFEAPSTKYQR